MDLGIGNIVLDIAFLVIRVLIIKQHIVDIDRIHVVIRTRVGPRFDNIASLKVMHRVGVSII